MKGEDDHKSPNGADASSTKSETTNSYVEKPSVSKKPEPVKVTSKYFNSQFDLNGSTSLISFLYEYQKQFGSKFTHKKGKTSSSNGKLFEGTKEETPNEEVFKKLDKEKLEDIKKKFRETSNNFTEYAKKNVQLYSRDMREVYISFKNA